MTDYRRGARSIPVVEDDRTPEQKATHTVVIGGTDRFMSGWGGAAGGSSVAGWACRPEVAHIVERWVRNRRDMTRVRYLGDRPRGAHIHIYVVEPGHPALREDA